MAFAAGANIISANCGNDVLNQILSDDSPFRPEAVMAISRTHPDRQVYETTQVQLGRRPFVKPLPGVLPPFDTHGLPEVLRRLPRNAGLLDYVTDALITTTVSKWPTTEQIKKIRTMSSSIVQVCRKMKKLLKQWIPRYVESGPPSIWSQRNEPKSFVQSNVVSLVASVLGISNKNLRDLPRVLRESRPTVEEATVVVECVERLSRSAVRLLAVIRANDFRSKSGPASIPGTYIVVFYLPKALQQFQVGGLGVFDFPSGYYAYLGSAYGGGGVRTRTHRHLTKNTPKKWNVDWLKQRGIPVCVWWTYDRVRVEFLWAAILASMPNASFPALGLGSADNDNAQAHLVRFPRKPSIGLFRSLVAENLKGHAAIHQQSVVGWTGNGWPKRD